MLKLKPTKLLVMVLMIVVSSSVNAAPILDQEHFSASPNSTGGLSNAGSTFGRAQTFTVGLAGLFDSIDVQVNSSGATMARILGTAGSAPIGGSGGSTVLATSSAVTNLGDIFTFDFSAASLAVAVGDILAIELFGSGSWRGVSVAGGGSYAGGSDYFFNTGAGIPNWTANPNFDWNFRTYVDAANVPEPTTITLLALSLAGLGFAKRKKI